MTWNINGILMGVSGWVGGCIPSQPVKNSRKRIEEEEEFPIRAFRGSKLHICIIPLFVCVHVCDVYWSITGQPLADQRSSAVYSSVLRRLLKYHRLRPHILGADDDCMSDQYRIQR